LAKKETKFQKEQRAKKFKGEPDETTKVSRIKVTQEDDVSSATAAEVEKARIMRDRGRRGRA
jgi:hypothetical protein